MSDMTGNTALGGVDMDERSVEAYLDSLILRGRTEGTVQSYRGKLQMLRAALPADGALNRETLESWRRGMSEAGYSPGTVNAALSVVNGYLAFIGRKELQMERNADIAEPAAPELLREEYIRLLQAARQLRRERAYMLTKVFATTGLTVSELPRLTAQAVEEGAVVSFPSGTRRVSVVPRCLREELLGFARRAGAMEGPIFTTRGGAPLSRTYVSDTIRALSSPARVEPEKCNPRSLRRLYLATKSHLEEGVAAFLAGAYERMLENEQLSVGWEDPMFSFVQSARAGGI